MVEEMEVGVRVVVPILRHHLHHRHERLLKVLTGMKEEEEDEAVEVAAVEDEVVGDGVHGVDVEEGHVSWYRKVKYSSRPLQAVVMPPVAVENRIR